MTKRAIVLLPLAMLLAAGLFAAQLGTSQENGQEALPGPIIPYETVPYVKASSEKMKWWRDAKFGLFVHWGVYAVPAGFWSKDSNGNDIVVISVSDTPPQQVATVIAVECEGSGLDLAPFKHAYDVARKQIYLAPSNFQVHAGNIKNMSVYYDRERKVINNWRYAKGGGQR